MTHKSTSRSLTPSERRVDKIAHSHVGERRVDATTEQIKAQLEHALRFALA